MKSDNAGDGSYASQFRRRRFERLAKLIECNNLKNMCVLDIGGTMHYWKMNLKYLPEGSIAEIDIVNLPPLQNMQNTINGVNVRIYAGDALDISSFRKKKYDLVHSNSVIEHVGNLSSQKKFADAILSLGGYYWIQSPAKLFPLEPHFYVPYFSYMPLNLRAFLLRTFNLGFYKRESDWLRSRIICEDTRLLTRKEYSCLFAGSRILTEKFFFTKSYIATNFKKS